MKPGPLNTYPFVFSAPRIDGGSNLARTEFSADFDAAKNVPPAGTPVGSGGFAFLNLSYVGNIGMYHAGLNPAANLG